MCLLNKINGTKLNCRLRESTLDKRVMTAKSQKQRRTQVIALNISPIACFIGHQQSIDKWVTRKTWKLIGEKVWDPLQSGTKGKIKCQTATTHWSPALVILSSLIVVFDSNFLFEFSIPMYPPDEALKYSMMLGLQRIASTGCTSYT